MKQGLCIVAVFFIGAALSFFGLHSKFLENPNMNKYVLYVLLFLIGVTIGHNKEIFKTAKEKGWRILAVPFSTIVGGLIGVALVSVLIKDIKLMDTLAIGSGLGYYSLSSVLIGDARGMELGTIALLANIIREILALLFIPVIVKVFGRYSAIVMGGATTMDSTLPIIQNTIGTKYTAITIVSGFCCDLSVPILVGIFLLF